MTDPNPSRLFDLLPQIYRVRDADPASNGALEALLDVIDQQVGFIRQDIGGLWNNFFIETCDEWIIPYIGDLVGTNLVDPVVLRARTDVAKTIHYRRRKGTVPMLEELARDVTGWSAKAVEFFQVLGWTQNVNHVRPVHGGWFDVVDDTVCNAVGTAFDQAAHSVDVRLPAQNEGWYNIRNIGFFLWRLQSYSLINVDPANAGKPHRFHFNTLGQPEPLFIQPDLSGLSVEAADEDNVRGPISPRRLEPTILEIDHADPPDVDGNVTLYPIPPDASLTNGWPLGLWLELIDPGDSSKTISANLIYVGDSGSSLKVAPSTGLTSQTRLRAFPNLPSYYGQRRGFSVSVDGELVSPNAAAPLHRRRVLIGDLCNWQDPDPGTLVIDVRLGRFAFAPGETPLGRMVASFNDGFSGDIGAGPYDRQVPDAPTAVISQASGLTLDQALTDWQTNQPGNAILEIQDSHTYALSIGTLAMPNKLFGLTIRAGNGERPTILLSGDLVLTGGDAASSFTLEGLLVSGGGIHLNGSLGRLTLSNCTLDPGGGLSADGVTLRPPQNSLLISPAATALQIVIRKSIVGGLLVPDTIEHMDISDSIVDAQGGVAIAGLNGAGDYAVRTTIEATTIFGKCWLHELTLGSEVLFNDVVLALRKQNGCVRFSYIPPGSETPRRYRCLPPDGATPDDLAHLIPSFTSVRFGDPGYAQLSRSGPDEIATGGSDGSEIGAFFILKNPVRRQNLIMRLAEYLPFGLAPALIEVT